MKRCLNCMREYPDHNGNRCPFCGYEEGTGQEDDICLRAGSILQGRYIVGTVAEQRDIDIFYHAWDALFDRKVLVQEYLPRYCAARAGQGAVSVFDSKKEPYERGLALFMKTRELIRLYREEDVETYHAVFCANGTAYAVTEDAGPLTLRDYLKTNGALREAQAVSVMDQVLRALVKCHQLGIYHGMLGTDSFWLRSADGSLTGGLILRGFGSWRNISGKPGVVGYGQDPEKVDVYGAAKILYELLSGRPYDEKTATDSSVARGLTGVDSGIRDTVMRALNLGTDTLSSFWRELDGMTGSPAGPARREREKKRWQAALLTIPLWAYGAAAACGLLLLGAGGFLAFRNMKLNAESSQLEAGMVRVPNIVNRDVDVAELILRSCGLDIDKVQAVYSDEIQEGAVSYQEQKEGSLLPEGSRVSVWVSLGPEPGAKTAPESESATQEEMRDPAAGEETSETHETEPVTDEEPEFIQLELVNILYQDQETAEAEIRKQGLSVGEAEEKFSDSVEKGKVILAKDSAGNELENHAQIESGGRVCLVISKGKDPAKQTTAAPKQTQPQTTAAPKQTKAPAETAARETIAPLPVETARETAEAQVDIPPEVRAVTIDNGKDKELPAETVRETAAGQADIPPEARAVMVETREDKENQVTESMVTGE